MREELEFIRMIHRRWALQVNPAKSSVMVNWMGKGSNKHRSKGGKFVKLTDGELIPVVKEQTHLGSIRHVTGSTTLMVDSRIKKYRGVKARFQKKLLGNQNIPLPTRVKFFQSLLTPVLVHGLECVDLGKVGYRRLEGAQMRALRGATGDYPHKGGRSNNEIRVECGIPTVESQLRLKRLRWWRRNLTGPLNALRVSV